MTGFNRVILIGHLTKNPELKYTSSGTPIARFALAVNRIDKQGDEMKEEACPQCVRRIMVVLAT